MFPLWNITACFIYFKFIARVRALSVKKLEKVRMCALFAI